jgi:hypothetical protein
MDVRQYLVDDAGGLFAATQALAAARPRAAR